MTTIGMRTAKVGLAALAGALLWSAQASAQTPVLNGGTGRSTLTAGGVLVGNGTSPINMSAAGTAGQVLQSNGAAAPSWVSATPSTGANTVVKRSASGGFSAGTITANLNGHANTAGAFATNGTNCPAGQFSTGIDTIGNAEGCAAPGGVPAPSFVSVTRANVTDLMNFADSNGQGSGSRINFDTEQADTLNEYDPVADTFTATNAGVYQVCSSFALHPFSPLPAQVEPFYVVAMTVFDMTGSTTLRMIDVTATTDAYEGQPTDNTNLAYQLGGCVVLSLAAGRRIQVRIATPNIPTVLNSLMPLAANSAVWMTVNRLM